MKDRIESLISELDRYIKNNKNDSHFAQGGSMVASLVRQKLGNIIK